MAASFHMMVAIIGNQKGIFLGMDDLAALRDVLTLPLAFVRFVPPKTHTPSPTTYMVREGADRDPLGA